MSFMVSNNRSHNCQEDSQNDRPGHLLEIVLKRLPGLEISSHFFFSFENLLWLLLPSANLQLAMDSLIDS
jgi:hypothetical protein